MKITQDDFAILREAVCTAMVKFPTLRKNYSKEGISHKRYRWDMLYLTGLKIGDGAGMRGDVNVYAYANDDHIDTALRAIMGSCY